MKTNKYTHVILQSLEMAIETACLSKTNLYAFEEHINKVINTSLSALYAPEILGSKCCFSITPDISSDDLPWDYNLVSRNIIAKEILPHTSSWDQTESLFKISGTGVSV